MLFAATLVASEPALAEPKINVEAIIIGEEGARFVKGVPTLDLQKLRGAVQIRPLGFDHGRLVFGLAYYNDSSEPANAGPEGLSVAANETPLRIFTVQDLIRKEKNRAMWSQIGLALLGATSSALAASQRNTYRSSFSTPSGTYRFSGSYPSLAGQIQASQIQRDTTFGMMSIQHRLDQTIERIGDQVIQRTTVDPGDSYAGRIVIDKISSSKLPQELRFAVDWNGERYPFGFVLTKSGSIVPDQYRSMLAANAKPKPLRPITRFFAGESPQASAATISVDNRSNISAAGAVALRSGAMKVPTKTQSGFCLIVPPNYAATGSLDYPLITKAMPLCAKD